MIIPKFQIRNPKSQRAFTLVELLVVIAIIAILATLVVTAAFAAINAARNAAIRVETGNLTGAIKTLKTNNPSLAGFPPDGTAGAASFEAYLTRMFTRRITNNDPPLGIDIHTGNRIPADLANIGPTEALHFWLSGFSTDVQHPLSGSSRTSPLFTFDPLRLTDEDNDGWLEYAPRYCQGTPYVYFAAPTYSTASYAHHNAGVAVPYATDIPLTQFAAQESFQIITAGQDGDYGTGGSFPSGVGYSAADQDNITSFSEGTLADGRP